MFVSIGTLSTQPSTKRSVVSDIAHTFDVLGWLAPSTISMKVLFQHLWEMKLGWDEEVPSNDTSNGETNSTSSETFLSLGATSNLELPSSQNSSTVSVIPVRTPMLQLFISAQPTPPGPPPCLLWLQRPKLPPEATVYSKTQTLWSTTASKTLSQCQVSTKC